MARIIKTLLFLLIPIGVFGQLAPISNQYVLNPLTINPAFAGSRGALNIATFYRKQWVGVKGAPETFTFSIDAPFSDQRIGLGLIIVSDKIGVTKENQISTNYSYKINIGNGILAFGLGAGVIVTNTAFSDLIVIDPGDEIYLADSRIFVVPNFSFGIHYNVNNYFAGFSIPRFLSYKFDFDRNKYVLNNDLRNYSYIFNTGYLFEISPKLKFFPSALLRYSIVGKFQYDVNTHFCFFDKFWIGASYRNNRSIAGLFQFQPNNQLRIAYTYDFDISRLGKYSNGSHEIMLRYEFRYKVEVLNPLVF
jgi:type IX secretion system PorP/SprF family membrane protein